MQGSFFSFSEGKGGNGPCGVRLLFVGRITDPSVPCILTCLLLLRPPDPDPSCHLLEIVSFSEEKETKDRAAFVSSLSSSPPFHLSPPFSSFISYFPCYPTHPLAWISALLYLPQQVDCCVFLCFFRPHARLARCVRYSAEPSIEFPGP